MNDMTLTERERAYFESRRRKAKAKSERAKRLNAERRKRARTLERLEQKAARLKARAGILRERQLMRLQKQMEAKRAREDAQDARKDRRPPKKHVWISPKPSPFMGQPGSLTHSKLKALLQAKQRARERLRERAAQEEGVPFAPQRRYIWYLKGFVTVTPSLLEKAKALMINPDLKEVVNAPKRVLDRASHLRWNNRNINYVVRPDVEEDNDENITGWIASKRQAPQTPTSFTPNVYSCVLGQSSHNDPPEQWTPYPADDFYAHLQEKTGRVRDGENGELVKATETPPFPELAPPDTKALPQTQLLEQIHRYVSGWAHKNYPLLMNHMDESALLGMGVAVEEKIKEMLGKDGDLFYAVKEGSEGDAERLDGDE